MISENSEKNIDIYKCELCDYICYKKQYYKQHLLTLKHQKCENDKKMISENSEHHKCNNCGKKYNFQSNLSRHKKNCKSKVEEDLIKNENISIEFILEIVKQNQDFKELILEQNKQMQEQAKQNMDLQKQLLEITKEGKIINNNNNKFNLQIFLNEKCKDAPNLIDFINSIQLKLTDFENFGTFGYADNISRILLREIKDVDIYKRPIHCSDLKREIIHVKDENAWKKDEDKRHMKKAIKEIAYKNFKKIIPEWIKANPDSKDITSKKHDQYIKMMNNSMGEVTEEGDEKNYNKIIRTVAKEVLVEKEK